MNETNFKLKCEKAGFPNATMEDIIQMCRDRFPNKTDIDILSNMRIAIARLYCNNYQCSQRIEDFWILFYMAVTKGVIWDDSKHEWTRTAKL